jgi:FkbM family methyltransferase
MLTRFLPEWLRSGEREEKRLTRYVPRHLDVVDLGAGKGEVGARAVSRLLSGRRYVGLEMQPELVAVAETRVRRGAHPGVHVRVVHGAICSTAPTVGIWNPGQWHSCATTHGTTAPAVTLTTLLERAGITGAYTLLMDIEGAETDVIANDHAALRRAAFIIVELHDGHPQAVNPWACPARESLARLLALGLTVKYRGRGEVYALEPPQAR